MLPRLPYRRSQFAFIHPPQSTHAVDERGGLLTWKGGCLSKMLYRLNLNLRKERKTHPLKAQGMGGSCFTGSPPLPFPPPPLSPPHTPSAVSSVLLRDPISVDRQKNNQSSISQCRNVSCFAKNIQDIHTNWPLFPFLPYFCVTYLTLCCTCGHINQIHDSTQSYTSLQHNVLLAHPAAPLTCPPAGSESPLSLVNHTFNIRKHCGPF